MNKALYGLLECEPNFSISEIRMCFVGWSDSHVELSFLVVRWYRHQLSQDWWQNAFQLTCRLANNNLRQLGSWHGAATSARNQNKHFDKKSNLI